MSQPDQVPEICRLDTRQVAVVLVDFQNDFCRDQGSARARDNADAARAANSFAAEAARLGARVIYTQQVLDPGRLTPRQRRRAEDSPLCRAGSEGAELFIEPVPGSRIVRKYRFDVWQSEEFRSTLSDWEIDGLILCGVELICCVLYAVLGAEEHGYHYVVPQDLVSGMRETPANTDVRSYLRSVHPSVGRADELLRGWRRDS